MLLFAGFFNKLSAPKLPKLLNVPSPCQFADPAVSLQDFYPAQHLPAFVSSSKHAVGLWKTNLPQFGHFFLAHFVPPVLFTGVFDTGGLFSLSASCPWVPMIAFIFSNIASIARWFAAANASICLLCCSCSSANINADALPSSSAAASSWAARVASLNHDCFAVACEYWQCLSHFAVK